MAAGPVLVRRMAREDIDLISSTVSAAGWNDHPRSLYENYAASQEADRRVVLLAFWEGELAGFLTVIWESNYPPFRDEGVPEVNDFGVLPSLRRRGIGTRLMDEAEAVIATRSPVAGIGVGMMPSYGPAQRLYAKRGYVPDGRGLWSHDHYITLGETVVVDHDLYLCLTKALG